MYISVHYISFTYSIPVCLWYCTKYTSPLAWRLVIRVNNYNDWLCSKKINWATTVKCASSRISRSIFFGENEPDKNMNIFIYCNRFLSEGNLGNGDCNLQSGTGFAMLVVYCIDPDIVIHWCDRLRWSIVLLSIDSRETQATIPQGLESWRSRRSARSRP